MKVTTEGAAAARAAIGLVTAALRDRSTVDAAIDLELLINSTEDKELLLAAVATLAASMLEESAALQKITSRERVQQLALALEKTIGVPSDSDEV